MANAKILEAKQNVIDEITDVAKNSASFILFDYRGLTAEEVAELRRTLRENGAQYKVWKNTLTKRAMDGLNFNLDDCLNGPSAMAYSDDSVAPIKVLSDFAKEHKAPEIKGGIVDGKYQSIINFTIKRRITYYACFWTNWYSKRFIYRFKYA